MRSTVLALSLLVLAVPAFAQRPSPEEQRRIAQAMMAAARPGPEHQRLAALAGTWDVEILMYGGAAASKPMRMMAVVENRMILGGRFLESSSAGGQDPMRFESLVIYGFDRRHGKYTLVAHDVSGTYYVTAAGGYADSTRTITMSGTDDDPVAKHTQIYDMHLRFVDDDTYVTDVVFTDAAHTGGKGAFKAYEAIHRRRK